VLVLDKPLYFAPVLPSMQNKLYPSSNSAINSNRAVLSLIEDPSGYIFNQSFDPGLVSYDADYQNDQGYSAFFHSHLKDVVSICSRYVNQGSELIVDVGCGKGGFVEVLLDAGYKAIGYDNTYEGSSPYIRRSFFDRNSHDRGNLLTLRHVLEHVQKPWAFIKELALSNNESGYLYVEVPDLGWILDNQAYFDLFHEHVNYFTKENFISRFPASLDSIVNLFGGQYIGLVLDLSKVISDLELQLNCFPRGDSLRKAFNELHEREKSVYKSLADCKSIVIWGAASKGVIFAAKAPSEFQSNIRYAIDLNPKKVNLYMPLSGVKVHSVAAGVQLLHADDTVLIVNPNYKQEIVSALPPGQPIAVLR